MWSYWHMHDLDDGDCDHGDRHGHSDGGSIPQQY